MTRKDFQLIADMVATVKNGNARNELALNFVHKLHQVNERFDAIRFLEACKVSAGESSSSKEDDDSFAKEKFIAP